MRRGFGLRRVGDQVIAHHHHVGDALDKASADDDLVQRPALRAQATAQVSLSEHSGFERLGDVSQPMRDRVRA